MTGKGLLEALLIAEPFHLRFDKNLIIRSRGKSYDACDLTIAEGASLSTILEILRPKRIPLTWEGLRSIAHKPCSLRHKDYDLILRGQFVFAEESEEGLFIGSPWFSKVEEYTRHSVSMQSLPVHYGTVETLFILQTAQASLEDFKKLTGELQRQRHELIKARSDAEQALKIKTRFLAMMSHEIRTPINGILGMLQLLSDSGLSEAQKEYAVTLQNAAESLLRILNDILDFSRMEVDRFELIPQPFQLDALLSHIDQLLFPMAAEKLINFQIQNNLPQGLWLFGDELRLQQILLNLLSNAIKFTDKGYALLQIDAAPDTQSIIFQVKDSGVGIDEATRSRLFQPFETSQQLKDRNLSGTGLGLVIVHRLVELMGGSIKVISEPHEGTLFTIELPLPLLDQHTLLTSDLAKVPAEISFPHGIRVLLVEDNDVNARITEHLLHKWGLTISRVSNGQEAVELARRESFNLILMDCQMPVMDGLEATKLIRAIPGPCQEVPIVALTANVFASDQAECLASGMDAFIPKPIEVNKLATCISQLIRKVHGPAHLLS
jgi:signal transduction histidine kinase/ActR/RegA family two-component response regulator